jgi:glycosyltransferase involved in cell wall biosynthesis
VIMRVLLASDFYPPFIGGAELQTQVLGTALRRRGHAVEIATVWHSAQPEHEILAGLDVHRLKGLWTRVPWFSSNPHRRFHPPLPDPALSVGLRRLIREFEPDVVQACGWIAYSCAAALRRSNVPLILTVRDYGYSCALRTLMRDGALCDGPAVRKCLSCAAGSYGMPKATAAVAGVLGGRGILARKTAAIHCVSKFVEATMRRDFLKERNPGQPWQVPSVTIPDIVTIPEITEPDAPDQLPGWRESQAFVSQLPGEPFILFVGALQPHKGLTPLLAAYAQLSSPPPLVLIGSVWPDTPTDLPDGVKVFRNVAHADVMRAWERSLFGVAPSIWPDPLPGTVREAMSSSKAVIGSAAGGIVDMVSHERTGLLVRPGDVAGLRDAMTRLIGDSALRDRLGSEARRQSERFAADAVAPHFEQLYAQLLESRQAA